MKGFLKGAKDRLAGRFRKFSAKIPAECESEDDLIVSYRQYSSRKVLFMAICFLIIFTVFGYAITIGPYEIGFWESYETIWRYLKDDVVDSTVNHIVVNLRLPRIIEGIIAGAGLAMAGAVMQSVLKNPLADPYTTGISSGASLGATLSIISGISLLSGNLALIGNAFVFSLIPVAVIVVVAKLKGGSPVTMILSGLAVMYFFNAITTTLMLRADPEDVAAVYTWQVGTLSAASWDDIPLMLAMVILGAIAMIYLSSKINILSSGDDNATTLGVNASQLRIICLLTVSLVTASIVSFTGIIGFVGLVCPHIVRMFIGADNRYLIPASALFGSAFLIACDLVGRTILDVGSIQVGVITSFIGGPMFLYLILRQKGGIRDGS